MKLIYLYEVIYLALQIYETVAHFSCSSKTYYSSSKTAKKVSMNLMLYFCNEEKYTRHLGAKHKLYKEKTKQIYFLAEY